MLHVAGRFEDALGCYDKALSAKPDYAQAYLNIGNVQIKLGRPAAAVSFQKAIVLKPDLTQAHNNLGNVLVDLGTPDSALDSFNKALELNLRTRLPKTAPPRAKKLFRLLKKAMRKKHGVKTTKSRAPPPVPQEPKVEPEPIAKPEPKPEPVPEPEAVPERAPEPPPLEITPAIEAPPEPPPPEQPTLVHAQPEVPHEEANVGAYAALGVGAVGIIGGVVLAILATSTNDDAFKASIANDAQVLHEQAVTQQTLSFISFGVGGAGLLTAGILLATE